MKKQPFDKIKVLDLSWAGVGPIITTILAEHGATVVRVESIKRPGPDRTLAPYKDFKPGINRSGYVALYNLNKYSLALDLNHPKALETIMKFVKKVDIVAEAFAPGFLKSKGLDYKELKKVKRNIILFHTSMQGHTGPHAHARGLGFILTSLSGITNITGWPDRPPSSPLGPYTDYLAPWIGAAVLLSALDYRDRTGKGMEIDHSQLESIMHYLTPSLLEYQLTGKDQRMGNRSEEAAPHGVYPCRGEDRWCAIGVTSEERWKAFCEVTGNIDWIKDNRFATFANRKVNEDELDQLIAAWTRNLTPQEVVSKLQSKGIAAGVVQIADEILSCPQLNAREYWWMTPVMEIGTFPMPVKPYCLSKTPVLRRWGTPCLGEHTELACKKVFGMSNKDFDKLLVEGLFE